MSNVYAIKSFVINNLYIIKLIIGPFIFFRGFVLYIITFKPRRYCAALKLIKLFSLKGRIKTPDNIRLL